MEELDNNVSGVSRVAMEYSGVVMAREFLSVSKGLI